VDGSLRVRCACGWEVVGVEDEVVVATQEHGRRMHNMAATRDQVLAMAVGAAQAGERPIPRHAKPDAR
jgi:predicted small metal-binding protein